MGKLFGDRPPHLKAPGLTDGRVRYSGDGTADRTLGELAGLCVWELAMFGPLGPQGYLPTAGKLATAGSGWDEGRGMRGRPRATRVICSSPAAGPGPQPASGSVAVGNGQSPRRALPGSPLPRQAGLNRHRRARTPASLCLRAGPRTTPRRRPSPWPRSSTHESSSAS